MREILLINPRKKKRTTKKKAAKKRTYKKTVRRKTTTKRPKRRVVAKRRLTAKRRAAPRRKTTRRTGVSTMAKRKRRKTRARRNPSRARRTYKRGVSRARSTIAGLNFASAFKNMLPVQVGMFAAKFGAKRFGLDASETDPESWNWASYLKGALGGAIAAFLAQNIKPGSGQKVLEGAMNYITFKVVQNELIAGNETASRWLGGAEEDEYYPDEYMEGADDDEGYLPGDVATDDAGQPYLLGESGWEEVGETLQPVGPLGEALQPVGPLGNDAAYRAALLDN